MNAIFPTSFAAVLGAAVLLCGCAHKTRLVPAPQANRLEGNSAFAEVNNVRIMVKPDEWSGNPSNLADAITPIEARVDNRSTHPLRIRYRDFKLVTTGGFESAAIPPFRMRGSVAQTTPLTTLAPAFTYGRFYVAPYYAPFYGTVLRPWPGRFFFDGDYWATYYHTWRQPLPTPDMLEKAIPEGVLQEGGYVDGFLYFQKVKRDIEQVTFTATLMDATTEESIGTLRIPFNVQ